MFLQTFKERAINKNERETEMSVSRIVKNGRPGHAWYVVAHNFIAEDGYHYRHKHASCSTRPEAERLAETLLRNSQCVYISCGPSQSTFWVLNRKKVWKEVNR